MTVDSFVVLDFWCRFTYGQCPAQFFLFWNRLFPAVRGLLKCLGCVVVLAPSLCFVPFDPDDFSQTSGLEM